MSKPQPASFKGFNRGNALGRACRWAVVPAWDRFAANSGSLRSVGQQITYSPINDGGGGGTFNREPGIYPFGSAMAGKSRPSGDQVGYAFYKALGELGPVPLNDRRFTFVALVRAIGNASLANSSGIRIYSKSSGINQADTDLGIQLNYSAGMYLRGRIRWSSGSTTQSTNTTTTIQSDALNLMMVGGYPIASNQTAFTKLIREDGQEDLSTANTGGEHTYAPRSTTDEGIFIEPATPIYVATADLLMLALFDGLALVDGQQLSAAYSLMADPWQIFNTGLELLPVDVPGPTVNAMIEIPGAASQQP